LTEFQSGSRGGSHLIMHRTIGLTDYYRTIFIGWTNGITG